MQSVGNGHDAGTRTRPQAGANRSILRCIVVVTGPSSATRVMTRGSHVCQFFCVNGPVLFLGMGARWRKILRSHDATLARAGIRSGHRIVKWFKASLRKEPRRGL
jgi:hypothetical protein